MNTCDLDEAKHVALEKFKELTANPDFEFSNYRGICLGSAFQVGPFVLIGYISSVVLSIEGVFVAAFYESMSPRSEDPIALAYDSIMRREEERRQQDQCEAIIRALRGDPYEEAEKPRAWWKFWATRNTDT